MKIPFKMDNVLNNLTCKATLSSTFQLSSADTDTDHKLVILSSFLHCKELAFALFSSSIRAVYPHCEKVEAGKDSWNVTQNVKIRE
jgi:hypothetical protein